MTVSAGGTISWACKTDSVYIDHAQFLITDSNGAADTLTFNIFVNPSNNPASMENPSRRIPNKNQPFRITRISSSLIKFALPTGVSYIDIYTINGACIRRLTPPGAEAVWNGLTSAGLPAPLGRYCAKIVDKKTSRVRQFTLVR